MRAEESSYFDGNIVHSDNTMKLILDPRDILAEVEVFLKGYYKVEHYDKETGETSYKIVEVGEPKANDKGVQSLMFWLKTKINPLVTMGNISTDQYADFLERSRVNLARNLMTNRINYGISLSNYTEIIDYCMECFEAIFTSSIRAGHRTAITRNTSSEIKEVVEKDRKKIMGVF